LKIVGDFMLFSDGLHRMLKAIENWVDVTGGRMLIDPATSKWPF
jgi:hypothetical protein